VVDKQKIEYDDLSLGYTPYIEPIVEVIEVDNDIYNTPELETQVIKSGYGPKIKDIDGNIYNTIQIGTQHWMAENLKVSKYNDGTTIPNIKDGNQWLSNTKGAWCYYDNNAANNEKYGKLYNWYAVSKTTNGNKNICPKGWHVPKIAEWAVLTDYLGGEYVAGGKMKEVGTLNWNSPNSDATNESLFTGLPGGFRYGNGDYEYIGSGGSWWSSSSWEFADYMAGGSELSYLQGHASISQNNYKKLGFSVRCLKD
jgi:uncharacterized protein (TIGR02145 family)